MDEKEEVERLKREIEHLKKDMNDLRDEVRILRDRRLGWMDDAVQYIIDNNIVPFKEIKERWKSLTRTSYKERFLEHLKKFNIHILRLKTRKSLELCVHNLPDYLLRLWKILNEKEGIDLEAMEKRGEITPEERRYFVYFCKKYFNYFLSTSDFQVTLKSRATYKKIKRR